MRFGGVEDLDGEAGGCADEESRVWVTRFEDGLESDFGSECCERVAVDVLTSCVGGSLAWCSCWCCCEKGNMENSVELRLWRLGPGGRSLTSFFGSAVVGGGNDVE
jgi:hypothetical protein